MRDHVPEWRSPLLLAAMLAGTILTAAIGPAQGPPPEKAAWYSFERPDEPGRSVGLTPWPAYAFRAEIGEGRLGSGLIMPGLGANGLLLPNPAALFGEEARAGTIALWIKPDFDPVSEPGERVVIDFMKQTQNTRIDGYQIVILTAPGKLAAQPALGRRMVIDTPLRQDEWTHVTLAWDAAVGTVLYIDGEQAAQIKAAFNPTPLEWWPGRVGSHTPSGGYPFKGAVDELRLYDRMLGDDEIRALAAAPGRSTDLRVSGWQATSVRVANRRAEPEAVWLRCWQPESGEPGLLWGGLPVPEHEFGSGNVYVGGASGRLSAAQPVVVAPGEAAELELPIDGDYLKWTRFSIMADEGLECREIAGIDRPGLICRLDRRYVAALRPAALPVTLENQLGRAFSGAATGELTDLAGETVAGLPERRLTLGPEDTAVLGLELPAELPPGRYLLRLRAAADGGGGWAPLRPVPLTAIEEGDYRTMFGVGAAYVSRTFGDEVHAAMAADRVKVLRRTRGTWLREPDQVEAHGLKMWYTPAFSSRSICTSSAAVSQTEELARSLGACLREKPTALNQVMLGEGLSRTPCYCDDCNAAFRDYLQERYGDIPRLNEAWGTSYESFRGINQVGSPRDVSEAAERMALMQRELPEAVAQRWRELFRLDPPRAIEWKRWHDGVLIDWYERFARAFHQTNKHHTALSEQPCWPDFKHHVLFALGDIADLGGMDLYLPGELPTTLGYASELFMNFDLNASIFHGKPLWVHELYVQDNSPPLLPEAQGWFLVGRGYSMLTYFTYDYYKEGIRANLPLIFGMFDEERKPYPTYQSFLRLGEQMEQLHRQYDAFSLRREEPQVAVFLGDDVSLANSLETGGETWGAAGVHGHIGAYWLAERNGFPVEFINDGQFPRLKGKRVLIVPWTNVIRPAAIGAILRFARSGGTVILDGPVGLYDDLYRPYSPLPGGAAMKGLGIELAEYRDEPNALVVEAEIALLPLKAGTKIAGRGVPVGVKLSGWDVLARDEQGSPALAHKRLGSGQVFWLLTNVGRSHRGRAPDPNAVALWRGLIASAGITSRHIIRSGDAASAQPGAADLDHGGKGVAQGDALCDAAIRLRGDNEAFVFLVSFFDGTDGELILRVPEGDYEVADAISGQALTAAQAQEEISLPIHLPPFGSQVIRVRCLDGAPFAQW